jgi:N-acetylmuramoyl-L-alanine amidase
MENSVILLEDNYEMKYKGFDPNSPDSVIGITLMQEEYLDHSIQLASIIQEGLTSKLNRLDRGVKQAGFVVLHQTYMPSVLIETGFITNKEEGSYLNSRSGQEKYAASISADILKYIQQITLNTVGNTNVAKNETKPESQSTVSPANDTSNIFNNIEFKVQIASGSNKIETKSYNFNGLSNVERVKVGGVYKYYIGNTNDYNEIKKIHQLAKSKGYSSAFIVAFENGKKISVEDVFKKS